MIIVYFSDKNKLSHNISYTAAPLQFRHVELYFWCGINGNKHTLTYNGTQGIHSLFNS